MSVWLTIGNVNFLATPFAGCCFIRVSGVERFEGFAPLRGD